MNLREFLSILLGGEETILVPIRKTINNKKLGLPG
jgi:hypothetical protein